MEQWTILDHNYAAGEFRLRLHVWSVEFFAIEAAFRAVLLLFNLLAEFPRAAGLPVYREPATVRTQVLTCGAILAVTWSFTCRKAGEV